LAEFGLTPETALGNLDQIDAFYTQAVQRINMPLEQYKEWEDEDFKLTRNKGGFTLTPTELTGDDNEHRFSLHFGKVPPEPEE